MHKTSFKMSEAEKRTGCGAGIVMSANVSVPLVRPQYSETYHSVIPLRGDHAYNRPLVLRAPVAI